MTDDSSNPAKTSVCLEPENVNSVAQSAVLHIGVLGAELKYLRDDGFAAEDLPGLQRLHDFISSMSPSTPPRYAPVQSSVDTMPKREEYQRRPRVHEVVETYVGASYQSVIADRGDLVIVYTWSSDSKTAIAYNPRNKTAGRIPIEHLGSAGCAPSKKAKILEMKLDGAVPHGLHWQPGDHLRVCGWDANSKTSGVAFNLRTLEIGKLSVDCRELYSIVEDANSHAA